MSSGGGSNRRLSKVAREESKRACGLSGVSCKTITLLAVLDGANGTICDSICSQSRIPLIFLAVSA
jgi:hypothetical protein